MMATGFPFNDVLRTGVPRTFAPPPRPRAPPRFIRPPTPVLMERPQPLVPDVSLLSFASTGGGPSFHSNHEDPHLLQDSSHFDDSSSPNYYNYMPTPPSQQNAVNHKNSSLNDDSGHGTSASQSRHNFEESQSPSAPVENLTTNSQLNTSKKSQSSSKSSSPPLSNSQYESLKTELCSVHLVLNNQTDLIAKLNTQFSQMVLLQEKLLAQLNPQQNMSAQSVHTQTDPHPPQNHHLRPKSPPEVNPQSTKSQIQLSRNPSLKKPETTPTAVPVAPSKPSDHPSSSKRTAADFSTVLRNLQISNVQAPSMYSETSGVKSIDCPPFTEEDSFQNDSIGPSASAQGSDLEEDDPNSAEEIPPSVTYYNNLITTVNRILDSEPPKKTTTPPPSSNPSKTHQKIPSKNTSSSSSTGSTASYTNYSQEFKENLHPPGGGGGDPPLDSVQSTKRYLQSIGVQFDSPSSPTPNQPPQPPSQKNHPQNYMIQQNVYNSIYIPTVNCVPIGGGGGGGLPDSFNSNSGVLDNLAKKYITSGDRNQYDYDLMQSKRKEPAALAGGAETTVYGMSPGNLSFATREYLKRHGLVDSNSTSTASPSAHPQQHAPPPQHHHHQALLPQRMSPPRNNFNGNYQSDKILDMTAIRNQPKLL